MVAKPFSSAVVLNFTHRKKSRAGERLFPPRLPLRLGRGLAARRERHGVGEHPARASSALAQIGTAEHSKERLGAEFGIADAVEAVERWIVQQGGSL